MHEGGCSLALGTGFTEEVSMDAYILLIGLYGLLAVVSLAGMSLYMLLVSAWRYLIANPAAQKRSVEGFHQGSPFNTRHGMVIDMRTGIVGPSDGPHYTGEKSVFRPLLGSFLLLGALFLLAVLIAP